MISTNSHNNDIFSQLSVTFSLYVLKLVKQNSCALDFGLNLTDFEESQELISSFCFISFYVFSLDVIHEIFMISNLLSFVIFHFFDAKYTSFSLKFHDFLLLLIHLEMVWLESHVEWVKIWIIKTW